MVTLFVEGGGDHNAALKARCRRGFSKLLERAGFKNRMPRIVACGGRRQAYDQFCTALNGLRPGDAVLLLVDAETEVGATSPWVHVRQREGDEWPKPAGAEDRHLHLMVQTMEAWFLADRAVLGAFFGKEFRENALPAATAKIEKVSKSDLNDRLGNATRSTQKGTYSKGEHSFDLLAKIDLMRVCKASPWAKRFVSELQTVSS
jgi:hypothetical protein